MTRWNPTNDSLQIAEVLVVFSVVSQSLRTGEPIHTTLPPNLLDRLLYHHTAVHDTSESTSEGLLLVDEVQALDHLYYAPAVIAVFQLMEVCSLAR